MANDQSAMKDFITSLYTSMPTTGKNDKQQAATRSRLLMLYHNGEHELFHKEAEQAGIPEEVIIEAANNIFEPTIIDRKKFVSSLRRLMVDKWVDAHYSDVSVEIRERIKNDALDLYQSMEKYVDFLLSHPAVVDLVQKQTAKPINCFYNRVEYAEGELRELYGKMAWDQWIDNEQTSEDDFVFFFSGHGVPPLKRIRWMRSSTSLSFFIKRMTEDTRIWKITSKVFEIRNNSLQFLPVDGNKLNVQYYTATGRDKYLGEILEVDRLLASF